jgi:hypothetical protein
MQLSCAPEATLVAPAIPMRVVGGYEHGKMLFGPDDPLIIGAGTNQGLRTGQDYFVRRVVRDRFTPMTVESVLVSVHTAGWVRIIDAKENLSVATVTQACDGVSVGDFLEPFAEPVGPAAIVTEGQPDYAHPARLVLADERRQSGYPGMLMLIDRGEDDGIRAGQRLTIFRYPTRSFYLTGTSYRMGTSRAFDRRGPVLKVGEATILNVRPQTALVRIDTARDAVYVGDLVALHR